MFTGHEDFSISLTTAAELTSAYRAANPGAVIGAYFGADAINSLLAQDGCIGIRYYYGLKDDLTPCLVVVGCDANENDILIGGIPIIIEMSMQCPPNCSTINPLNSSI